MNPSIFLTCVEKMKSRKMKKNDTHPRWFCVFKTHPFLGMIVKTYKNNNPWKLGEKNLVKTWIQVWLVTTSPRGLNLWAFRYRHIGIPQQRDVRSSKSSSVCWLNWRSGLVGGKKIVQSSQKFHTETERFLTSWKKLSPNFQVKNSQKSLSGHRLVEKLASLVGGVNPSEKYESNWIISPSRGDNKKYLKPPPSFGIPQVSQLGLLRIQTPQKKTCHFFILMVTSQRVGGSRSKVVIWPTWNDSQRFCIIGCFWFP